MQPTDGVDATLRRAVATAQVVADIDVERARSASVVLIEARQGIAADTTIDEVDQQSEGRAVIVVICFGGGEAGFDPPLSLSGSCFSSFHQRREHFLAAPSLVPLPNESHIVCHRHGDEIGFTRFKAVSKAYQCFELVDVGAGNELAANTICCRRQRQLVQGFVNLRPNAHGWLRPMQCSRTAATSA